MSDLSPSHKFDFDDTATPHEAPPPHDSPREPSAQDASQENPPPSSDLESMLDDNEELGFVDIDDFVQLQNHFDVLNKSHKTLNQDVTMLTEFITNFIKINSPQNETHAGTSSMVALPHVSSTHAAPTA